VFQLDHVFQYSQCGHIVNTETHDLTETHSILVRMIECHIATTSSLQFHMSLLVRD